MRKALMIAAGVLALAAVNWSIHAREALLRDGRVVLLELAPVDPRSLMQGDYMALRFKVADDAFGRGARGERPDGHIVVRPGDDGVATFVRIDDATSLAPDELRLRYRWRAGEPKFATNAFFFEEGTGKTYAGAHYGELRVGPDGESILTGLRDAARRPLGAPAAQ
jgi:uncharacterized membrane-anchored protein